MANSRPSLSPEWKARLRRSLDDILSFSEYRRGAETTINAESKNGRTILEVVEDGGALMQATLQLALPQPNDLEMLKLSCWTLLFLKSLFPGWTEMEAWVKGTTEWTVETDEPIEEHLQSYRVVCIPFRWPMS
jgi:hypothetical protein